MSNALIITKKDEASETAEFCYMMDRFFDCLNVRNYSAGIKHRKKFQEVYQGADDERLQVQMHNK